MKSNKFYLLNPHGNVGSNLSFHGVDGYTIDIQKAKIFDRNDALTHTQSGYRNFKQPETMVSAQHLEKFARNRVDMQLIDTNFANTMHESGEYVVQIKGCYDGNDVPFATGLSGERSYNVDEAMVFSYEQAVKVLANYNGEGALFFSKEYINSIKRPTIPASKIDYKEMIIEQGVSYIPFDLDGDFTLTCPNCKKEQTQRSESWFYGCTNSECYESTEDKRIGEVVQDMFDGGLKGLMSAEYKIQVNNCCPECYHHDCDDDCECDCDDECENRCEDNCPQHNCEICKGESDENGTYVTEKTIDWSDCKDIASDVIEFAIKNGFVVPAPKQEFIVEFQKDCWLDGSNGDPGRTCNLDSAKTFRTERSAHSFLKHSKRSNPHRTYSSAKVRNKSHY
ncbi:hypothetical protein [Vibrio alginolyticus]|uniref:hypothetical protein n=1 Tax=Vibrio alginolyticus TaxID=663 RepID=UPI0006CA66C9|nr:hypothetical protein [Vibrio alginolyticus]KPM98345.1 hypothetical protein AOG25_07820 [Vibrio alginolyticus]